MFAHNEEVNIAEALVSVLEQFQEVAQIRKIIVVSSGSTDGTNQIVLQMQKKDPRIHLIIEPRRRGKSAAINRFLREIDTPVAVTMSADLVLDRFAVEEITLPFLDDTTGMVGAHPVPINASESSIGAEMELMWQLHHQVSLKYPKCGELVAFRNIIHKIPKESAVDEATIEVLLTLIGYQVVYAPRSLVYNKVPRNVREFMIQRRRVYTGHQWVHGTYNYTVSTLSSQHVAEALAMHIAGKPADIGVAIKLVLLEILARSLGWIDYNVFGKNPYKWSMVSR